MIQLDDFVCNLSLAFKKMGYKKNRLTWYMEKEKLTVVFSIQKSQYESDTWYYYFGICLHDLANEGRRSMHGCQVKYRVDNVISGVLLSPEKVVNLLERWDSMYGDLRLLRTAAIEGNLPGQCTVNALSYLSSI